MSEILKALIVDDEALSADLIEYLVRKNVPVIGKIKKTTSAVEAIELIRSFQPHLVFLDIQMPFMSGFELLEKFPRPQFRVIFTTAFNKYAIRAIRFSALDYLLKPVDPEELSQAVNRYLEQREQLQQFEELYRNFIDNLHSGEDRNYRLALQTHNGIKRLSPADIKRCEGHSNYTHFFLADNSVLVASRTIREYEELLSGFRFLRVHKSHLVNLDYAEELTADNWLVLTDKTSVEVSRRRRAEVAEAMRK